jgi:hypothetical protein
VKSQDDAAILLLVLILAAGIALTAVLNQLSKAHVVEARFWFDNVTFEMPHLGGPITKEERQHVPESVDPQSYEYEKADRAEQFFGSMHWDTAWPFLVKELGP